MAALFALDVGKLVAVGRGRLQLFGKTGVKVGDYLVPVCAALLYLVEVVLHVGGEAHVHYVGEVVAKHVGYLIRHLGGHHILAVLFHIVPAREHGNYACVGRGPAYALFLHSLYERGIGVAQRRTGELLLLGKIAQYKGVALLERGQQLCLFVLVLFPGRILIGRGISRKQQRLAARLEGVAGAFGLYLHCIVLRLGHLRGNESVVDQLIYVVVFFVQQLLYAFGRHRKVDGADGLVRVLRALFGGVAVGLCGRILFAVSLLYELYGARLRLLRHAHRVRSYIGYERDVVAAHVHAFVEVLRHEHGFWRGHAVFVGGVLLQRRSGEGCGRMLFCYAALYLGDGEWRALYPGFGLVGGLLAYASAALFELAHRPERGVFALGVLQKSDEVPVLFGHERLYLALSVDYKP